MELIINGVQESVEEPATVLSLVRNKGYNEKTIVVECNGNIVLRDNWDATILKDQDKLEVVSFVGGG